MSEQEYRLKIYLALSELLKEPDDIFFEELPSISAFLDEAFSAIKYVSFSENHDWIIEPSDFGQLADDFRRSFVYPPGQTVIPVESVFRPWTTDDSVKLPFAKQKGFLLGDSALHMRSLYHRFSLSIPNEFRAMPDHLCLELEFCAHLLKLNQEDELKIYLNEHLYWLEDLEREALSVGIPQFYQNTIKLANHFITLERERKK